MANLDLETPVDHDFIAGPAGRLEIFAGGLEDRLPVVCAAHPAGVFGEDAVRLLSGIAGTRVVCVNPRGLGASARGPWGDPDHGFGPMVDDLDAVRRHLGLVRWAFWGMSGGGWLGLEYADRVPEALAGLILESVCPAFRLRLADPECLLSPFHPAWRPALEDQGLIDLRSHLEAGDPWDTEWQEVESVGAVFRRRDGPALLVSPMPVAAEMAAAMPLLWAAEFRPALCRIDTPTLILAGSADPLVPLAHVRALHEGIAGSRLAVVEGAGHVPTANGGPVTEAVRTFLEAQVRGPSGNAETRASAG